MRALEERAGVVGGAALLGKNVIERLGPEKLAVGDVPGQEGDELPVRGRVVVDSLVAGDLDARDGDSEDGLAIVLSDVDVEVDVVAVFGVKAVHLEVEDLLAAKLALLGIPEPQVDTGAGPGLPGIVGDRDGDQARHDGVFLGAA